MEFQYDLDHSTRTNIDRTFHFNSGARTCQFVFHLKIRVAYFLIFPADRVRNQKTLSLQEVIDTVKQVWTPPQSHDMGENRKISDSDLPSPVLLRRRLSAPETIMRKHLLAQRAESQDSDVTDVRSCQWRSESGTASDPNLSKKRDSGRMRKSTLLRRLWGNSKTLSEKTPRFCHGVSSQSLGSNHSSPDHTKSRSRLSLSEELKSSPKRVDVNKNQLNSPNYDDLMSRKSSINGNYESVSPTKTTSTSMTSTRISSTTTPRTENTETERYSTTTDHSDSAYANSRSNFSHSSTSYRKSTHSSDDKKNSNEQVDHNRNECSTQTSESTNLNVISNIQLSQSTLDLIFNQVMQDVQNASLADKKVLETNSKIINVQERPSFYLKPREEVISNPEHNRLLKYMISNVGAGSPYSKPAEVPQVVVPRFSAIPRTSSMEVNTSSGDSTDKESDNVSLVDSLEDPSSPRIDVQKLYERKGDLSPLLPDNSDRRKLETKVKPAVFFIPMQTDIKSVPKPVAEHLPEKVREKLSKRQLEREQKLHQLKNKLSPRSDSNYISASDNGTHFVDLKKEKRRSKPVLPRIESIRKFKIDSQTKFTDQEDKKNYKPAKRKQAPDFSCNSSFKHTQWRSKTRHTGTDKLSPLFTTKNEYVYDSVPKRIYHKTELNNSNKRIEILEIVECIDTTPERHRFSKSGKSKIPILIQPKLPKIVKQAEEPKRPTFLDLGQSKEFDPKIDQLIANILIDALNRNEVENAAVLSPQEQRQFVQEKRPAQSQAKHSKYQQKFEVIEEERSVSLGDTSFDDKNEGTEIPDSSKGKAALSVVRDENSTFPKGWITFYMLNKSQGSPDSTSDEGMKRVNVEINEDAEVLATEKPAFVINNSENHLKNSEVPESQGKHLTAFASNRNKSPDTDGRSSTSENGYNLNPALELAYQSRKRQHSNRKVRYRHSSNSSVDRFLPGEWAVTVTGTNYSQFAPNLEMHLKFPNFAQQNVPASQSDSGLGEENSHEKNHHLPFITNPPNATSKRRYSSQKGDGAYPYSYLPEIVKMNSTRKSKRYDSSSSLTTNTVPLRIEPRQTRTSSRRFSLHLRKKEYPEQIVQAESDEGGPRILTVTGNAISPERKPRVPTMSEKDVTRFLY